jgi:N6-L-threonylcarbamoyladenine synthase
MRILGIETSCDETSVAVVEDGRRVLSNVIASSRKEQEAYGGVFPECAARRQLECIVPAVDQALKRAKVAPNDLDAIAVTKGPGLLPSLLVGAIAARSLASVWKKPLIGVHHNLGHLVSPWLECEEEPEFPILSLSVSGGHTELWLRKSHTRGTLLGRTLDDAAGEAFDKGATLLGLPYPGGPALSALAKDGDPKSIKFPTMLAGKDPLSFSFAGLKTSLKYLLRDAGGLHALTESEKKNIAASFQEAICTHLLSRLKNAMELHTEVKEVHLVGGVSANTRLREGLKELVLCHAERRADMLDSSSAFANARSAQNDRVGPKTKHRTRTRIPARIEYCTDNAAMIAAAAEFLLQDRGKEAYGVFKTEASLALAL